MSAFELRSNLPCNQQLWEADSAELWQRLRKKQKSPPLFLSLVKAYLTPGAPPIPRNLNALSRLLLLHGLMSISWDMKRRDQTSLGLVGKHPIGDWKTRMSTSYNTWKADFDAYCTNYLDLFCTLPDNATNPLRQEFVTWSTANAAVYHAAHVLLNAEFLDLQIYAGARHILGRPVGRADYVRSQRVVKRWASAPDELERLRAARAARHAALLIREGVERLNAFDAGGLFHYPWCLYLATLTCWAWWHARPQPPPATAAATGALDALVGCMTSVPSSSSSSAAAASSPASPSAAASRRREDDSAERHLEAVAKALRPAVVRRRTSGLTAVVARHLSKVRWAVVHDGMMVLKGLVPWRMIGGADGLA
ncbi:hypothetical protein BFW01_g4393 [Lasiodiplodia theobromae]|nr:hypothetical protein BFW01_g4393 [Lasiodiplodia theobromae]